MVEVQSSPLEQKLQEVTADNLDAAVTSLQKLDISKIKQVITTLQRMSGVSAKDWNEKIHGQLLQEAIKVRNSLTSKDDQFLGVSLEELRQKEKELGAKQWKPTWDPNVDGPKLTAITKQIKHLEQDLPDLEV